MRETILALLIAKFSGVRKDGLTALARGLALQCTTEDEAKGLVDKITDAQVTEFVKDYRADVDKEVSDSNQTFKTNLEKKFNLVEKKVEPGDNHKHDEKDGNLAELVKEAVAAAVKPFQDELAGYKQTTVHDARLQSLNDKLAECKDEGFKSQTLKDFARIKFDSDEDFNEYLNDKVADIAKANQDLADRELAAGGSPLFNQKDEKSGISQGVADYLESLKPESDTVSGKEL